MTQLFANPYFHLLFMPPLLVLDLGKSIYQTTRAMLEDLFGRDVTLLTTTKKGGHVDEQSDQGSSKLSKTHSNTKGGLIV
jgi:hypothetical protein